MALVSHHRFLRSSHIILLVVGSSQQISRRLQLLYHHGYLERPRAQLEYFHRGGSQPMVYGLGNKGAALLKRALTNAAGQNRWSEKNRIIGRMFLQHALFLSDVLVGIELACRERQIRFSPQHELISKPLRWRVNLDQSRKLGVIPDAVFALELVRGDEAVERAYFFLEADRGTMPVQRRNLNQTSFHRKLLAYEATWAQKLHETQLGFHRFRVLTVTSSEARMRALIDLAKQLKSGKGLFLFTHKNAFDSARDVLGSIWHSPQMDKPVSLFE